MSGEWSSLALTKVLWSISAVKKSELCDSDSELTEDQTAKVRSHDGHMLIMCTTFYLSHCCHMIGS